MAESITMKPIVRRIPDKLASLEKFEDELYSDHSDNKKTVLLRYPTVYIHNYPESGKYDVYIGETNDIIQRTHQHFDEAKRDGTWQSGMLGKEEASLYVIGHSHLNKSLTLDIENRLMLYLSSVDAVNTICNRRGNEQDVYYTSDEFIPIFTRIWEELRKFDKHLFPDQATIEDAAIFKASPFHKLTQDQKKDKEEILRIIYSALDNEEKGQLVFVEGEAGTGKTVLNSSLFYDLCIQTNDDGRPKYNCHMIVNHDEQLLVYQQIASKVKLRSVDDDIVTKPTTFINSHLDREQVDVVFVDEAHLLWSQGKQSYRGKNQLEDICKIARVVVIMFDEHQQLNTQGYWDPNYIEKIREKAKAQYDKRMLSYYFKLTRQLRIHGNDDTVKWIRNFVDHLQLDNIPKDEKYEIRIFDDPKELDHVIAQKAANEDTKLSRIIATFDWKYIDKKRSAEPDGLWYVSAAGWKKPWNKQIDFTEGLSRIESRNMKKMSWAEQPFTIQEVGSTFTIQGFDLNYAGVILGPSVKYRDGRIVIDPSESQDAKATRNRTLEDGTKKSFGEMFIRNEINILLTRGVDGLYIYAVDEELRAALKRAARGKNNE